MIIRSLGYESQKIILQYMDTNDRILLNHRCPSLQNMNSMFPLRISEACVTPCNVTINDTKYRLDVLTQENDYWTSYTLENDGVLRDRGFYERLAASCKEHMRREPARLKELEDEMEKKRKRVADIEKLFPTGHSDNQALVEEWKLLKGQLQAYDINPPQVVPLCPFVQVTIRSPSEGLIVERTNYRYSLSFCEYYFFKRVFSGFKKINIEKLTVDAMYLDGDIRFPRFPKVFSVRELKLLGNIRAHVNCLLPSLANPSVETLWLCGQSDYTQEFIKQAKVLVILGLADPNCLQKTSNTEVIRRNGKFNSGHARNLINDWRNRLHPVGRKYSVEFYEKDDVVQMMKDIQRFPGAVKGEVEESRGKLFPYCVTFPMGQLSELNVYARTNLLIDPELIRTSEWEMLYYVIFQIHPKGHATPS